MRSVTEPLKRIAEEAAWFARAHDVRLMHVAVESNLRRAALTLLAHHEWHADNFSPWILLENASTVEDDGWHSRAVRAARAHAERRKAMAETGVNLGEVVEPSGVRDGLATFGVTLARVVDALRPPLAGVVCVLAPLQIDDRPAFLRVLETLVRQPTLAAVRWVMLEVAPAEPPAWPRALEPPALSVSAQSPPGSAREDVAALMGAGQRFGTVGPKDVPRPKRVGESMGADEATAQALKERGVRPDYVLGGIGQKVADATLAASMAIEDGRGEDAIRSQGEARDLLRQLEMWEAAAIAQLILGSYLVALQQPKLAERELDQAVNDAKEHDLPTFEAQARMALGLVLSQAGRVPEAAQHYAEAGRCAERGGTPALAIECWRLAGQLCVDARADKQAVTGFNEAIRIANASDAPTQRASSAPEASRRLAKLLEQRGQHAQATALWKQAELYEQGPPAQSSPPPPQRDSGAY